jgi:hypothetical protein
MAMHHAEICNVESELELMGCELIVMQLSVQAW